MACMDSEQPPAALPPADSPAASSCLPGRPAADHEVLLGVVRRWPQGAYSVGKLQAAVLE